jgi:glutathione reductase (NADPH)
MERKFDVVVVGSGSAGTNLALAARRQGRTVAVIEERPFGGTCALRGCDPKKALVAAARTLQDVRNWSALGVFDRPPLLDWSQLMRFKHTFTDPVPDKRRRTYEDAGVVPVQGHAEFVGRQTLRVGDHIIHASGILIATGAKERHVAKGDDILHTSDTFLDLESLPKSLIFVGGGYIAFELAHVAARRFARHDPAQRRAAGTRLRSRYR